MKKLILLLVLLLSIKIYPQFSPKPIIDSLTVFRENAGLVVVEAEHFYKQTNTQNRAWYINSKTHQPHVWPDYDAATFDDAGGSAYVEALPDLFHDDNDPIINGHNLGGGGSVAVMHYKISFNSAGRYYIWTRLRSNDQEDNTTAAGIDGTWPVTSQTLQSPVEHKKWVWKSENRLKRNPWTIGRAALDVKTPGVHDVLFSMREDGEEFDRFILTMDSLFAIEDGIGPDITLAPNQKLVLLEQNAHTIPKAKFLINPDGAFYGANVLYADTSGIISFEAENFYRQTKAESRMWHLVTKNQIPSIGPDGDPAHIEGASQDAYLEVLPDARQKDEDAINSKSSILGPGAGAVLGYMIDFPESGRYYVWVRAFGVDGDDNTLHVGFDSVWPASGLKLHVNKMNNWEWICNQRDTKKMICVDIPKKGIQELMLSVREDGFELDRVLLTMDSTYKPNDAVGIPSKISKGLLKTWLDKREERMNTKRAAQEENGLVVIEAESIPASIGWNYFADSSKHTGYGYYEWNVEGQGIKPGNGILIYDFNISREGNYQILFVGKMKDSKNRLDTKDPDGNDIWLKLISGSDVSGEAKLSSKWNKIAILGHPEGWTLNTNLDVTKEHVVTPVCRYFGKGIHSIMLSGRSQGYAIDKIILKKITAEPISDFDSPEAAMLLQAKESEVSN